MFSTRWRKVLRDLWSNKTRTVLVVLALLVAAAIYLPGFMAALHG